MRAFKRFRNAYELMNLLNDHYGKDHLVPTKIKVEGRTTKLHPPDNIDALTLKRGEKIVIELRMI